MESVRCEVPEAFRRNLKKSWKCLLKQEKTEQPWKIKGRRRDDGSNRSSDGTSSAFDHTGGWTRTGTGIQDTIASYHKAVKKIAEWKPDTVVVLSPHTVMYADYFHISPGKSAEGSFGRFGASQVKIPVQYDTEFVKVLSQEAQAREIPAGTLGEQDRRLDHGTMIPLWFLNHYDREYKVVRIGLSGLRFQCTTCLGNVFRKRRNCVAENCGDRKRGSVS